MKKTPQEAFLMTRTKIKDIGRAFAILAGLLFLACTAIKLTATALPALAYLHDRWIFDGEVNYMQVDELCSIIEILALAGFTAICFSMQRTKALMFPILAVGFVNLKLIIDTVWYEAADLIGGKAIDIFSLLSSVFVVIAAIATLLALLFFIVQTAINTSFEKGVVSQVFLALMAFVAVALSSLAYLLQLSGDVLGFFSYGRLEMIGNGLGGFSESLLVPVLLNLLKLCFAAASLFFALWLVFRPKKIDVLIETKEEKKARIKAEKEAKKAEKKVQKAEKEAEKAEKKAQKDSEKAIKNSKKAAKNAEKEPEIVAEVTAVEVENAAEYDPMEDVPEEPSN